MPLLMRGPNQMRRRMTKGFKIQLLLTKKNRKTERMKRKTNLISDSLPNTMAKAPRGR